MKGNYHSFNYWKTLGRVVIKGEKSKRKNKKGIPIFHIDQTTPILMSAYHRYGYDEDAYWDEQEDVYFIDQYYEPSVLDIGG